MGGRGVFGGALVVLGAILGVPVAIGLGVVLVGFDAIHALGVRRGLHGVGHERALGRGRVAWGDTTSLSIAVSNRARWPIS